MEDKILTNITGKGIKGYLGELGFKAEPQLNFEDDGSHFRIYSYKGIPMSILVSEGTVYLDIRVDYLPHETSDCSDRPNFKKVKFPYSFWMDFAKTKEVEITNFFTKETKTDNLYTIADTYNGSCESFSLGGLIGYCEATSKGVDEANKAWEIEKKRIFDEDVPKIREKAKAEKADAEKFLEDIRSNFDFFSSKLSDYETRDFKRYFNNIKGEIEELKNIAEEDCSKMDDRSLYLYSSCIKEIKTTLKFSRNDFYAEKLTELVEISKVGYKAYHEAKAAAEKKAVNW